MGAEYFACLKWVLSILCVHLLLLLLPSMEIHPASKRDTSVYAHIAKERKR